VHVTAAGSVHRRLLRPGRWGITWCYTLVNAVTPVRSALSASELLTNCEYILLFTAANDRTFATNVDEVLRIDRRWDGICVGMYVSTRTFSSGFKKNLNDCGINVVSWWIRVALVLPAMAHWGSIFSCFNFSGHCANNSNIQLHMVASSCDSCDNFCLWIL